MEQAVDVQAVRELVTQYTAKINAQLPANVKRIGPVELTLSFDPDLAWYASFSYMAGRRGNSQKLTGHNPHTNPEDALKQLDAAVKASRIAGF